MKQEERKRNLVWIPTFAVLENRRELRLLRAFSGFYFRYDLT
jgi:hypothetical protein